MKYLKYSVLCISLMAAHVHANVGVYTPGNGGVVYPGICKDFIMTSEKIEIDVYHGYDFPFVNTVDYQHDVTDRDFYYIEYDCSYSIKNKGNDQKCILGYPIQYGYQHSSSSGKDFSWPLDPELDDIRIQVNGEYASFKKYIQGMNPELITNDYDEVYAFESFFKAGEEKTINVRHAMVLYTTIFRRNTYLDFYIGPYINYILKSGQTYMAPIGEASIDVRFHFAGFCELIESPGNCKTTKDKTNRMTFSWRLANLKPMKDIFIRFDNDYKEEYSDAVISSLLKKVDSEKNFADFLDFTRAIGNKKHEIEQESIKNASKYLAVTNDKKAGISAITLVLNPQEQIGIRALYKKYLISTDVPPVINGFILSSIERDPKLDPGSGVFENAKKKVDQHILSAYYRDIDKIESIVEALRKSKNDTELLHHASQALISARVTNYFHDAKLNNSDINNYFYSGINGLFRKDEYQSALKELRKSLETGYYDLLETLLTDKADNVTAIVDLIQKMMPAFGMKYLEKVNGLRIDVENKGEKEAQAGKLRKLLQVLLCVKSENSHFLEATKTIIHESRDMIRKSYYALANYYFTARDFDKAVLFYRVGFSYCPYSPLWDYFSCRMFGAEWCDSIDEDHNTLGVKSPWWKALPDPYKPTEQDIADLYSPDRLLSLKLDKWESEGETNAPAYYLAYNTACAYSLLSNADASLQWIKVALKLNKTLKKLIPDDKDLVFLRSKHRKELDILLK